VIGVPITGIQKALRSSERLLLLAQTPVLQAQHSRPAFIERFGRTT